MAHSWSKTGGKYTDFTVFRRKSPDKLLVVKIMIKNFLVGTIYPLALQKVSSQMFLEVIMTLF